VSGSNSGGGASSSGGSSSGGDDSDDGPPQLFDVGAGDGLDEEKCERMDFLFVIDNSGSMSDEQMSLIASFPGFIQGITTYISVVEEYHVGVVATEPYPYNAPSCQKMGALVTQTSGTNSSDAVCGPYADGANYMTTADDLDVTFPCAAQVGTQGVGTEQPLEAMVQSLEHFIQSPGQCNEGFMQDDALLVVTIITDEDDQSGGPIEAWYNHLVWLKGDPDNIVILVLAVTDPMCSTWTADRLVDFSDLFLNGYVGDVCAPSYDPFFWDALGVVQDACTPPIG
jgi:hypothetical protein